MDDKFKESFKLKKKWYRQAVYLISKDELLKIAIGQPEEKSGVKIVVKSKVEQVDKKENNPATVVKLKVANLESKFESKVTMNLYHSNQGFHLQGGRRQGKNTSCSLAATYWEQFFKNTLEKKKKSLICKVRETLLQMDRRKQTVKFLKWMKMRIKSHFNAQRVITKLWLNMSLKDT